MGQTRQSIIERLVGIAAGNEIPIEHVGEGCHVIEGESSAVFFDVDDWGDGHLVHLFAPAVVEIPPSELRNALAFANRLNRDSYFVKWSVRERDDTDLSDEGDEVRLYAECDLLADALDAEEFLNGLDLVITQVDSRDEGLASELGGKTYQQAIEDSDVRG